MELAQAFLEDMTSGLPGPSNQDHVVCTPRGEALLPECGGSIGHSHHHCYDAYGRQCS